jgi:hypothetical protein
MRTHHKPTRKNLGQQGIISLSALVLLAAVGLAAIGVAMHAQVAPPKPQEAGRLVASKTSRASGSPPYRLALPYARPISLTIPSIGVHSRLQTVGKNPDGSVQVPHAPHYNEPAWYRYSPAPGQSGASVILGHIDSYFTGPSVFFSLGRLRPGNKFYVRRADGRIADFTVYAVREYPKNHFPTAKVYTGGDAAELRLITCGGSYNETSHHYDQNTVVFAKLTAAPKR